MEYIRSIIVVIVNGQTTDRANIYEYKHWIDFKNKLNKLDYLYHNEKNPEKWLINKRKLEIN